MITTKKYDTTVTSSQNCVAKCTRLHLSTYSSQNISGGGTPLGSLWPSATRDLSPNDKSLIEPCLVQFFMQFSMQFLSHLSPPQKTHIDKIAVISVQLVAGILQVSTCNLAAMFGKLQEISHLNRREIAIT